LKFNSEHNFAIVDAAMNDMLRPALYQAWLDILPVRSDGDADSLCYDVVGPVCETSDFIGKQRQLALRGGDLLAVMAAGAYGFTMSSNYNSRQRAAEVMVDGDRSHLVRERETIDDLLRGESLLPT
jgi:diaminopimelate decarboxylase